MGEINDGDRVLLRKDFATPDTLTIHTNKLDVGMLAVLSEKMAQDKDSLAAICFQMGLYELIKNYVEDKEGV